MDFTRTEDLYRRAARVVPGGVSSSNRLIEPRMAFACAHGAITVDVDGNEYIDYHAGFGPPILGYRNEAVARRLVETLATTDLVGVGTTRLEVELAEKIVSHVPSAERVVFCGSRSVATYHSVRVARAVTGRRKIVKF